MSEINPSDELRKMLDERGVEWWKASPRKTKWHSPVLGGPVAVSEWNGKMVLDVGYVNVTPEQAIAATLGNEESYTRDDVESAFVNGYSLGSLPVGSDPQWDENRQTVDEHMAELGLVRDCESERLKAENAKLRNLTKDMFACISHANEADWFYFERDKLGCGMSCTINGEGCGLLALADRMRELGIEVD